MEPGVLPNGTRVLAVERDVNVRPLALTVYMLRKDAGGVADCDPACENDWVPLLSEGDPRVVGVVHGGALGFVRRAGGTEHVTYDSDLLYLVANERVALTANV
jgi:predicted lipoprotein with Yx(FWY)xxD motif